MICTGSLLLSIAAGIFQCTDADAFALKFARISKGQLLKVGGVASARPRVICDRFSDFYSRPGKRVFFFIATKNDEP